MAPLLGLQINQVMLLLGIGLVVFAVVNRIRRVPAQSNRSARFGDGWRREGDSLTQPQRFRESIGSARMRSASASPDHEAWEVEMQRLAREIKSEIDVKMRALEKLIQRADEAHARLDASLGQAQSGGSNDDIEATAALAGSMLTQVGRIAGGSARPSRARSTLRGMVAAGSQRLSIESVDDPRFERVYALADAGFSAAKIAGQIGSQVGEVELILSLRQSNEAA
jgi:hypothetical protein